MDQFGPNYYVFNIKILTQLSRYDYYFVFKLEIILS